MDELKIGNEGQQVPLLCDSTGSLKLAGEQQYSPRTKHGGLRFFSTEGSRLRKANIAKTSPICVKCQRYSDEERVQRFD